MKINQCSYIIPKSGNQWWQQERQCQRPSQNNGRCKIHQRDKIELSRRNKIDLYIEKIKELGGEVIGFDYGSHRNRKIRK